MERTSGRDRKPEEGWLKKRPQSRNKMERERLRLPKPNWEQIIDVETKSAEPLKIGYGYKYL